MKKLISYTLLGGLLIGMVPNTSFAMARYIMPPWGGGTQFKADDNSKTFVYFDSKTRTETLVFKPEFSGNVKDFGIVIPVPTKPTVTDTSRNIFESLEQETNQPRYEIMYSMTDKATPMAGVSQPENRVEIIDVKDIGEYQAVTVKANDAKVFSEWLTKYKFALDKDTKKALSFYTGKKDWYFVLIRAHMSPWEEKLKDPTKIEKGALSPIAISFNVKKPMIPWRIMGGQLPLSKATIYVASREAYYIPQTDIQYANRIPEYIPTLNDATVSIPNYQYRDLYNLSNMTLIRHALVFDPKKISEDLYFTKGTSAIDMIPSAERKAVTIKTYLSKGLGILPSKARIFSTNGAYNGFIHSERVLEMGDKGIMVTGLQEFLISQGLLVYKTKKATGIFDQKTEDALVQFQSNNGLTQTGVTDPDTKKFILELLRKVNYPPIYY